MPKKKQRAPFIKIVDKTIKISNKTGNGILKMLVSVDSRGKLARYSLAYVNPRLCTADNGRVLGYDNSHGYHHRHFMGNEELVEFENYETIAKKFETEWVRLHEKTKRT
jgi:hypothetical protein